MGSVRASLAKSALDRTVAAEVDTARRAINRALAACKTAERGDAHSKGRVVRVRRDLDRAMGALGRVSKATPGYDPLDPDFMDEDTRADLRRAEWAERDRIKAEAEDKARKAEEERILAESAEEAAQEGAN